MTAKPKPKLAIVGAGWAGLCAAIDASEWADVTVFEAGREAGGRARTLNEPHGAWDNGQHILLGAYQTVNQFLSVLNIDPRQCFERLPLTWQQDQGLSFQSANAWPFPLNLLLGVLRAKPLSWQEKYQWLVALRQLSRPVSQDQSVATWLKQTKQSERLIQFFWRPLVASTMNTPLDQASLKILAKVAQDGLASGKAASDYLLPKIGLSDVLPNPAVKWLETKGVIFHFGHRVQKIESTNNQINLDGQGFDQVILAIPPYALQNLWPDPRWINWQYNEAIVTVYCQFAHGIQLPYMMMGGGQVDWFFDLEKLKGWSGGIVAVISCADLSRQPSQWLELVTAELSQILQQTLSVQSFKVISSKRATHQARLDLPKIDKRLAHHIYLAGDWTYQDYPATLESAARSGKIAAQIAKTDWMLTK